MGTLRGFTSPPALWLRWAKPSSAYAICPRPFVVLVVVVVVVVAVAVAVTFSYSGLPLSTSRAITNFWISVVPSPISASFTSRR